MLDWTLENLTAHDVARLRSIYEPLTESVRALIDATIRTEVGAEMVAAAKADIDAATARLRTEQLDGSYGVRCTTDGGQMPWGNVVIGIRNPVAPPLVIEQSDGGGVFTDFHLGAAYEGPPGHVHAAICRSLMVNAPAYCLAIAMFSRSSGVMRWSWLSSPISIWTQSISPENLFPVGP